MPYTSIHHTLLLWQTIDPPDDERPRNVRKKRSARHLLTRRVARLWQKSVPFFDRYPPAIRPKTRPITY